MLIDVNLDDVSELLVGLRRNRDNIIDRMGKAHMLWDTNAIKDQLTQKLLHIDSLRERILVAIRTETGNADVQDV